MDKRWRNLGILVLVVVLLVAGFFVYQNLPKSGYNPNITENQKIALEALNKNDVNYAEFKVALELFNYSIDDTILNKILADSKGNKEMSDLISFEKEQNIVLEDFYNLNSEGLIGACSNMDQIDVVLGKAQDIADRMITYVGSSNSLNLDSNIIIGSYMEFETSVDRTMITCVELMDEADLE